MFSKIGLPLLFLAGVLFVYVVLPLLSNYEIYPH